MRYMRHSVSQCPGLVKHNSLYLHVIRQIWRHETHVALRKSVSRSCQTQCSVPACYKTQIGWHGTHVALHESVSRSCQTSYCAPAQFIQLQVVGLRLEGNLDVLINLSSVHEKCWSVSRTEPIPLLCHMCVCGGGADLTVTKCCKREVKNTTRHKQLTSSKLLS